MQTSMKQTDLEEVRMVILSLLVARPGWTPITLLDNDYYEAEYKRIPWRPLGFSSLLEFLQSMPNCFEFTYLNGVNCVRGIADKSKHVSSLVSRQKRMPRYNSTRPYRSYYQPHVLRSRPKIPAENLNNMVQYVKQNPNGVNIGDVLLMIQNQLPYVTLTTRDIQEQLRDLGHQLYLDGDTIRPAMRNGSAFRARTSGCYVPPPAASKLVNTSVPSTSNVVYTVPEECSDILNDEDGFVRPNSAHRSSQPRTDERLASSLKECQNREEMINYYDYGGNQEEKYDNSVCSIDIDIDLATENESNKLSDLISQRMQSRLQQLIQKYPNGIKCSELADLYMQEFKMPLNYIELGFNSAGHFASLLPDIFYVTRPDTTGDFILYNADKKPIEQDVAGNDDQRISNSSAQNTKSQTNPIDIPNTRLEQDDTDSNDASFPLNLSPEVLHRFAPKDVALCDDINYILVTDLQKDKKKYLEVYIVEVFTPSFFWIHLRRNVKFFDSFMSSLGDFYEQHKEEYVIPKLALKRGLNCACIYNHAWHRAVIKAVKPDFRVTVMFYDYGTQKTYPPESIFYLAKQFFHLPAQAIPCGLYDVKPIIGERWKKSIIDRFIDKISEALLAATVVSVDPPNNSMMIILTDTTEKEDVRINDWLIEENLARRGKMVRTNRNFPFVEFYKCHIVHIGSVESKDTVTAVNTRKCINKLKQSSPLVSSNVSSNAMNENFLKNVKILSKIAKKKTNNNNEQKEAQNRNRLAVLVDLIKTRHAKLSSADISKSNIDMDTTEKVEQLYNGHNNGHLNNKQRKQEFNINFKERDSDDETSCNEKDFGTFHSIYGGHGKMTPFNWSVIRQINSTNVSPLRSNNLNKVNTNVNKERKTLVSPPIHDRIKDSKSCILKLADEEKEYFLTACNIDRHNEDVSQSVARLRRRLSVQDDNSTEMIVPRNIYEKLRMYSSASRTSSCDVASRSSIKDIVSSETEFQADENNKTRKTIEQKIQNGDDDDTKSVQLAQDVHHSPLKDTFEPNTARSQYTHNQMSNRYQTLLKHIKNTEKHWNSNSADDTKGWSSSDPDPLSYYSRSSSDETINTSDDDQREALSRKNVMSRFNRLRSFVTKSASKTSDNSKSNDETEDLSSDKYESFMYVKPRQTSLINNSHESEILRRTFKMKHECDTEQLDSDDLSDHEDSNSDPISDQPKIDDALVASDSTHDNAKTFITPVVPTFNDDDIDSDSTWDLVV